MVKVTLIGSGNVAQHLITAFQKADGIELAGAFSRDKDNLSHLLPEHQIVSDLTKLPEADLYIIAVTDGAIAGVSYDLPFSGKLVAHTSGSIPVTALDAKNRRAVFYPLQTFSKNKPVDFKTIPICLESEHPEDFELLHQVAAAISERTFAIDSKQRRAIHVSAVFVNNFVNHLYQIGNDICDEHQVPFEILKPLIQETAAKVMVLSPSEAQTGPAKRKDAHTIAAHLELLKDDNQKNIYQLLTQSIQSNE